MHVGERIEFEVTDLGHKGEGVGRVNGMVVFVPGAIPGERVVARVVRTQPRLAFAQLDEVVTPSPDRVTPPCSLFGQCGGCQLQHVRYPAQLLWKRRVVSEALRRIGGLENVRVHPTIGMDRPSDYRNKAQYPVALQDGGVVLGFYRQGSHDVVPATDCLIQHPLSRIAAQKALAALERVGAQPYNEAQGTGDIRHVLCRTSFAHSKVLLTFVTRSEVLPGEQALVAELRDGVPGLIGITQNINPVRGNTILGRQNRTLWGEPALPERLFDLELRVSAPSFFQVNPVQTEVVYQTVIEYLAATGDESVVDAYCGIGSIALVVARHVRRVVGIEVVPSAVEDARLNADSNGISNAEFILGHAERVLRDLATKGEKPYDAVILDPPRKGCETPLLDTLVSVRPRRIVYVSCNPATLARDLAHLVQGGFRVLEVQPVDMFPHTAHVEVVTQLVDSKPAGDP